MASFTLRPLSGAYPENDFAKDWRFGYSALANISHLEGSIMQSICRFMSSLMILSLETLGKS